MSPIKRYGNGNGSATWEEQEGDAYIVTGVCVTGQRFSRHFREWHHASCINLYRGSKWLLRNGKRFLISRVYN